MTNKKPQPPPSRLYSPKTMAKNAEFCRMIAIEDSRYVIKWLLQMHECANVTFKLPKNIEKIANRAIAKFNQADELDYNAAEPLPISDERIEEIVRYVTGKDSHD